MNKKKYFHEILCTKELSLMNNLRLNHLIRPWLKGCHFFFYICILFTLWEDKLIISEADTISSKVLLCVNTACWNISTDKSLESHSITWPELYVSMFLAMDDWQKDGWNIYFKVNRQIGISRHRSMSYLEEYFF